MCDIQPLVHIPTTPSIESTSQPGRLKSMYDQFRELSGFQDCGDGYYDEVGGVSAATNTSLIYRDIDPLGQKNVEGEKSKEAKITWDSLGSFLPPPGVLCPPGSQYSFACEAIGALAHELVEAINVHNLNRFARAKVKEPNHRAWIISEKDRFTGVYKGDGNIANALYTCGGSNAVAVYMLTGKGLRAREDTLARDLGRLSNDVLNYSAFRFADFKLSSEDEDKVFEHMPRPKAEVFPAFRWYARYQTEISLFRTASNTTRTNIADGRADNMHIYEHAQLTGSHRGTDMALFYIPTSIRSIIRREWKIDPTFYLKPALLYLPARTRRWYF
ncbi:hypothetical protein B7494_g2765 [Chlorociboria aeruginascens]|nr:hypothetical protein B7494_g2765 [Chlorociboria aeruginascens]